MLRGPGEDEGAHALTSGLDRAAGDVRLAGGRARPGGADLGVLGRDDHLLDPELGAADLLLDGDQSLADLGRGGVDGGHRAAVDDRQPDPRRGVVVEALGERDVLVGDRVAHAATYALAVGRVGHPARHLPEVGTAGAAGKRHRLQPLDQLGHRRGAVDDLTGRRARALVVAVAYPDLDRVEADRVGELVHQRLDRERGLHRAEAAHRSARRVVRVGAVAVHVQMGDLVGPKPIVPALPTTAGVLDA